MKGDQLKNIISTLFSKAVSATGTAQSKTYDTTNDHLAPNHDGNGQTAWYSDNIICNDTRKRGQSALSSIQFIVTENGAATGEYDLQKVVSTNDETDIMTMKKSMSFKDALKYARQMFYSEMQSLLSQNKHAQSQRGTPPSEIERNSDLADRIVSWMHFDGSGVPAAAFTTAP